jgi:hypothetical protein
VAAQDGLALHWFMVKFTFAHEQAITANINVLVSPCSPELLSVSAASISGHCCWRETFAHPTTSGLGRFWVFNLGIARKPKVCNDAKEQHGQDIACVSDHMKLSVIEPVVLTHTLPTLQPRLPMYSRLPQLMRDRVLRWSGIRTAETQPPHKFSLACGTKPVNFLRLQPPG